MDKILEWVDIKNKLNLTKMGGDSMGFPAKSALQNSNFLTFEAKVNKKERLNLTKFGGIKMGSARNEADKTQTV